MAGRVVLTGGGNLNCKHIAQIAGQEKITASILNVLQLCESKQAATVSIPSIGTGKIMHSQHHNCMHMSTLQNGSVYCTEFHEYFFVGRGGHDPRDSVKAILQGVKEHISCTHNSSLKKIFIVAFEDRTYDSMKAYFNKPRPHRGGTQVRDLERQ